QTATRKVWLTRSSPPDSASLHAMTMQTPTSVKPPANCTFSVFAKYYRSIFANGTDEDFLDHALEAFGKHQRGEDVAPAPVPTPPTTKPRVGVLVFSDLSSQISSSTARFGSENGNTATSSEVSRA